MFLRVNFLQTDAIRNSMIELNKEKYSDVNLENRQDADKRDQTRIRIAKKELKCKDCLDTIQKGNIYWYEPRSMSATHICCHKLPPL